MTRLPAPLLAVLLGLLALPVFAPAGAAAAPCPNEDRRAEQGAAALGLPDCRAYELVSAGNLVTLDNRTSRASIDGDALAYYTTHPDPGASTSGFFYLSRRGLGGWSIRSVAPQNTPAVLFEGECEQSLYFSPDLSLNIDEEGWTTVGEPARCKRNQAVLAPGEPAPYRALFVHDVAADSYRLINATPPGVTPDNGKFQDASDDFSRIVFSEKGPLTADAPAATYNFYVWADGAVRLITVLPDGTPVAGELAEAAGHFGVQGSGFAPLTGAVSADGSRLFFHANGALYLRQRPDRPQSPVVGGVCIDPALACTVQIDASQGPGASGGGSFWWASADGSRVFFTADRKLTADATAVAGKPDLYEYDVDGGALTDLTVNAAEPAAVRGVAGAAEDGSYVYFAANGAIAADATPGDCDIAVESTTRSCSLYVAHQGTVRFIATLAGLDRGSWHESSTPGQRFEFLTANVSPSGRYLAFISRRSLTGYDNRDIDDNEPLRQIYLYDAAANGGAGQLSCVSCRPDGERPDDSFVEIEAGGNFGVSTAGGNARWKTNAVLDDGSVFFDSTEPLLAGDLNERDDVYRYRGGQLHRITPGDFNGPAHFRDASPDGHDVFFATPQSLLRADGDESNNSIYDARVGGGFPQPQPPAPPCEGEACRGPVPPAPAPAETVSSSFQGKGNPKPRKHRKHKKHRGKHGKKKGGKQKKGGKRKQAQHRHGQRGGAKR